LDKEEASAIKETINSKASITKVKEINSKVLTIRIKDKAGETNNKVTTIIISSKASIIRIRDLIIRALITSSNKDQTIMVRDQDGEISRELITKTKDLIIKAKDLIVTVKAKGLEINNKIKDLTTKVMALEIK